MQNLVSNLKWKYLNCGKRCSCNNNNRQKTYHRSCVELSLFSMKTKEETGIKRSAYCEKCCSYLQFFFGNKILHYNHLKIQIGIYFSFSFFRSFFLETHFSGARRKNSYIFSNKKNCQIFTNFGLYLHTIAITKN